MRKNIGKVIRYSPIWISILIHLLLLFSMTVVFFPAVKYEPSPSMDIPAYVYNEPLPQHANAKSPTSSSVKKSSPLGIEKPNSQPSMSVADSSSSANVEKQIKADKTTEAIHLVGDKNTPPKPLIKIIGKALAAHLVYPKVAVDFNLKGRAIIGFTLHPDGSVSNVKVLKSSGAEVLDKAAVAGVANMGPLKGVSEFILKAEDMVVGIIFSGDGPIKPLIL